MAETIIAWILLALVGINFLAGTAVALKFDKEFKWYYVGNVILNGLLKLVVVLYLSEQFPLVVTVTLAVLLSIDQVAAIVKHLAHYDERVARFVSSAWREPARLRLGNPRNIR